MARHAPALIAAALLSVPTSARAVDHCGQIPTDTTWTAAAGPYHITCESYVNVGATLTIEPGTVVTVDPSITFYVLGTLRAGGDPANQVVIAAHTAGSRWNGFDVDGQIVMHGVDLSGAWNALIYAPPGAPPAEPIDLSHVTFHDNNAAGRIQGRFNRRITIADCTVRDNASGLDLYDTDAERLTVADNLYVGLSVRSATVSDSDITGNGVGVGSNIRSTVSRSRILTNDVGVRLHGGRIERSDIRDNDVGVEADFSSMPSVLRQNNMDGNLTWAVEVTDSDDVDAQENWWGSTDPAVIDAMVFDQIDLPLLGLVDITNPLPGPASNQFVAPVISEATWAYAPGEPLDVLVGCDGTDADGTVVSRVVELDGPGAPVVATITTADQAVTLPSPGIYTYTCTITDDDGLIDASTAVTIDVIADADSDGVWDGWDLCPGTVAGSLVDDTGCAPVDTDGDGVVDAFDACPATPPGSVVGRFGCTLADTDGDGIIDALDQCLSTPAGAPTDPLGCALTDTDGDGVLDGLDACPSTPAGAITDAFGCVIPDTDDDGVLDPLDSCPSTPAGEPVDADGCAVVSPTCVDATYDPANGLLELPELRMPNGACLNATLVYTGNRLTLSSTTTCVDACVAQVVVGRTVVAPSVFISGVEWWIELERTASGDFALAYAQPQ